MKYQCFILGLAILLTSSYAYADTYTWVPKFGASNICTEASLSDDATYAPTANFTNNIMVTDESSLIAFSVGNYQNPNSTVEGWMDGFYNLYNDIASTVYGTIIPIWKVYRDLLVVDSAVGNQDTASDATAVIIQAFATASQNDGFSAGNRTKWETYAKTLCKEHVENEYLYDATGYENNINANRLKIFAGGGGAVIVGGLGSGSFGYFGYGGQQGNALLDCFNLNSSTQTFNFANSGQLNATYYEVWEMHVDSWLYVAGFNGTDFSFMGKSYNFTNETGGTDLSDKNQLLTVNCQEDCAPSDYDDASRATRMCESNYKASILGQTGHQNLSDYCGLWASKTSVTNTTYIPQYYLNGTAFGSTQDGYFENGLKSSLIFNNTDKINATQTIDQMDTKVDFANKRYYGDSCYGNFRQPHATYARAQLNGFNAVAVGGDKSVNFLSDPSLTGFNSQNRSENYNTLVDWYFTYPNNATQIFVGTSAIGASNTAPNITSSSISPDPIYDRDDPLGYCTATDDDGDNLTGYYSWYKNGAFQFSGNGVSVPNGTSTLFSTWDGSSTTDGDTIIFECWVSDGTTNSSKLNSTALTLNYRPDLPIGIINSTTNNSLSELNFYAYTNDNDTDDIGLSYRIYRNGTLVTETLLSAWENSPYCLQETANATSSCGGLANGYYTTSTIGSAGIIYSYYKKPLNSNFNSIVQYKYGDAVTKNTTIGTTLWNQNSTHIRVGLYSRLDWNSFTYIDGYSRVYVWSTIKNSYEEHATGYFSPPFSIGQTPYNAYDGSYSSSVAYYGGWGYAGTGSAYNAGKIYEEALWWKWGVTHNDTYYLDTIDTSQLVKGDNWTLSVRATDEVTTGDWINYTFTIGNIAPNVTDVLVMNTTLGANCTYTFNDGDLDADSSTFRWFVNGSLIAPTSQEISSGNYTVGSNIKCEVTPYDGDDFGTSINSTNFTVGDEVAPVFDYVALSATSGTNDNPFIVYANITEANAIDFVYAEITDPNGLVFNFSMSSSDMIAYSRVYTPSTDGTYRIRLFAQDGNSNLALYNETLTYEESTSTSSSGGGAGGSGGGGSPIFTENFGAIPEKINNFAFIFTRSFDGQDFEFTANRQLSSCAIEGLSPYVDSMTATCSTENNIVLLSLDYSDAVEPISAVYDLEMTLFSVNGESTKIPVKVSTISTVVTTDTGDLNLTKILIFVATIGVIAVIIFAFRKNTQQTINI